MIRFLSPLIFIFSAISALASTDYVVLDDELTQLRQDFNRDQDKLRLVFIVGPSCGVCLRGMVDLQEAFLRDVQGDDRLHTYVLHVPALGAEERHVPPTIPLMSGPRITHYWDGRGESGLHYQEVLDLPMYAWDVWMIHDAGLRWESKPPAVAFWQHQLSSLEQGEQLDPDIFGEAVRGRLAGMAATSASPVSDPLAQQPRAEAVIRVEQPRGVMIGQHIRGRGGYLTLKRLQSVVMHGQTEADGRHYSVTVRQEREDSYERIVEGARLAIDGGTFVSRDATPGLSKEISTSIWAGFEMDGWLVEWKDKGHKVWRLGMRPHRGQLPWLMEVEHRNGQVWEILVDSHNGDAFRFEKTAPPSPKLIIEYDGFADVDGVRFPHVIRYFADGVLLATDRFDNIELEWQ